VNLQVIEPISLAQNASELKIKITIHVRTCMARLTMNLTKPWWYHNYVKL